MKINIYYGGRGLIGDPTLHVLNKIQEVLSELNVTMERYDLYEYKNNIVTLPQTLKDADGIILATTVEWYGIGGWMQQFLDSCWLYGDKEKISRIYMCPIVMSTTYGEREAMMNLTVAWEILGGLPCTGISGYIADVALLEQNMEYTRLIEKKAEELGVDVEVFQSNHEGAIIDKIQEAYYNDVDGIVINPGAFTHYSYAVRDALASVAAIPKIEVHISNVHTREEFRHTSVTVPVCNGQVVGLGLKGYLYAMEAVVDLAMKK